MSEAPRIIRVRRVRQEPEKKLRQSEGCTIIAALILVALCFVAYFASDFIVGKLSF